MGVRRFAFIKDKSARVKSALRDKQQFDNNVEKKSETLVPQKEENQNLWFDSETSKLPALLSEERYAHMAVCAKEWRDFAEYTRRLLQQELGTYGARLAAALSENARLTRENAALRTSTNVEVNALGDAISALDVTENERFSPNCHYEPCAPSSASTECSCASDVGADLMYTRVSSAASYRETGVTGDAENSPHAAILAHNARIIHYIESLAQRISKMEDVNGASNEILHSCFDQDYGDEHGAMRADGNRIRLPSLRLLNLTRPAFDGWRDVSTAAAAAAANSDIASGRGHRASSASTDSAFSAISVGSASGSDGVAINNAALDAAAAAAADDDIPPEMPQLLISQLNTARASSSRASLSPHCFAHTFVDDFASPRTVGGENGVNHRAATLTLPTRRQPISSASTVAGSAASSTQRLRIRMMPGTSQPFTHFRRQFSANFDDARRLVPNKTLALSDNLSAFDAQCSPV